MRTRRQRLGALARAHARRASRISRISASTYSSLRSAGQPAYSGASGRARRARPRRSRRSPRRDGSARSSRRGGARSGGCRAAARSRADTAPRPGRSAARQSRATVQAIGGVERVRRLVAQQTRAGVARVPPSTSNMWARSSAASRGCARKNGTAKPGTPSGENHAVESQTGGRKRSPARSSDVCRRSTRAASGVRSSRRPRSQMRTSSSCCCGSDAHHGSRRVACSSRRDRVEEGADARQAGLAAELGGVVVARVRTGGERAIAVSRVRGSARAQATGLHAPARPTARSPGTSRRGSRAPRRRPPRRRARR